MSESTTAAPSTPAVTTASGSAADTARGPVPTSDQTSTSGRAAPPGSSGATATFAGATASARLDSTPLVIEDLGLIDYRAAWERQREIAAERAEGSGQDRLLLLEHPFVFTAGRRTEAADMPMDGSPVIEVDRGGKITWHGPGQLVGYPIIRLAEPVDVVAYVRRLEEALIFVCAGFGLETGRVDGRSGVWLPATDYLPERKVAAIGVRVQRGVAMHGISLNCNSTLDGFQAIVPCGIRDAGVTTLSRELGREVTVSEVRPLVADAILRALDGDLPVTRHSVARPVPAAEKVPAEAE
ncbi:lipoyl(octanoyl) transferase LipB [Nocardia jejuensis]|uniref:lipoyl(octanoyl) transferase LipB n=1 Tax=Nocardia jejuensis TaxID=328049 RepID=UPI0009FC776D|nr:lipoyl(octanoyl) transferase LipB [Nocardia jejuensis]